MQDSMTEKFKFPVEKIKSKLDKTLHELKLTCSVFEKDTSPNAKAQLEQLCTSAEKCQVPGLKGYLFIPGSTDHPEYGKVDLMAQPVNMEVTNAEAFQTHQAVMALFTVESYFIKDNAGFKGTLRELVKMMPFAEVEPPSYAKYFISSPPKRLKTHM
jgi:hypothetical protein